MPRRAKVVDVLAVRLVKQGSETTRFRTGSPLHLSIKQKISIKQKFFISCHFTNQIIKRTNNKTILTFWYG